MLRSSFFNGKGIFAALLLLLLTGTAALAAGGHDADPGVLLKDFLYRVLNFTVAFGLLAFFITKPLRKGMAGRRQEIENALAQAQTAREEAEAKFREYDAKLSRAAEEIEGIYRGIRQEGELEQEKILANARAMAEKIKGEAEKTAAMEVEKARTSLRQEATALAISMANDILRNSVSGADHERLVNEYLQRVGELH
jgi:F-type H+-transporting ATPase subunit b